MKPLLFLFIFLFTCPLLKAQSVGIGTEAPHSSAVMDVSSTTQGMLIPRMTSAQREMISSPAAGLLVYDITTNTFWFRDNIAWTELVAGGDTEVHRNGPDMIYMGMTDSVGIGTMDPEVKLQVKTPDHQYGISHTTGNVEVATFASTSLYAFGGWIGTRSNHPFNLFAADGVNQFTLLQNGKIGLGTTSPIEKLHVVGNSYFNGDILINGAPNNRLDIVHDVPRSGVHPDDRAMYVTGDFGSSSGGIEFRHANATQGIGFGYNTIYASGSIADQDIGLAAKGAAGSLFLKTNNVNRIFISGDGKTGIGTSNPSATLDVIRGSGIEGTARFLGTTHHSHFNYSTIENTFIRGGKAGSHVLLNDLAGQGNVGIGTGNPVQKLHVAGKAYVRDSIGVGLTTPHAPIQVSNDLGNRRIVLYELVNNDHQFLGFGINPSMLRYQASSTSTDHVFYAGASATTSNELMRIKGNGNVGIGISPTNRIDIQTGTNRTGTHPTGRPMYVTGDIGSASNGVEVRHNNAAEGIGLGFNTIYAAGTNASQNLGLSAKGSAGHLLLSTNNIERFRINASGHVGIGTQSPNAPLQFSNANVNRKIVLFEASNNDHQFTGFGVEDGILRYQTANTNSDHIFYAGTSVVTSKELMRIKGNGDVTLDGIIESEPWIALTLGENWSHGPEDPVMYYKDKLGRVYFKGHAIAGANPDNTLFAIMPEGYRSDGRLNLLLQLFGSNHDADLDVSEDGYIVAFNALPYANYSVSNVSYRAAE